MGRLGVALRFVASVLGSTPPSTPRTLPSARTSAHLPSAPAPYSRSDAVHGAAIAAAVGSILAVINLGPSPWLRPWDFPSETPRLALDYLTPFLVASLGAVLANRKTRAALRGCGADGDHASPQGVYDRVPGRARERRPSSNR